MSVEGYDYQRSSERLDLAVSLAEIQAITAGIKLVTTAPPAVTDESDYDWHVEVERKSDNSIKYIPTSGATLNAKPDKTTTILGRYQDDTKFIIKELKIPKSTDFGEKRGGFNILNTPDELYKNPQQFWDEYNKPFIDNAIKRNDDFILVTKPTIDKLYLKDRKTLTGFGREYYYLRDKGYIFDDALNMMIKK